MNTKADLSVQIAKSCVIPICEGKKFSLVHKFPADSQRYTEWQNAIQKDGPIEKLHDKSHDAIRKRYFICARHFSLSSYKNIESRSLNLTAVPHLNLTNLDEYSLSKAYQLDQAQIEVSPKKSAQPNILNKLANNSKAESTLRSLKRTFDDMQGSISAKPIASLLPANITQELIEIVPIENMKAAPAVKINESTAKDKNDQTKEEPNGKLLALLEVNSAQYKKLLSVINTNSSVVVIDNEVNDLTVSTDNGKIILLITRILHIRL